MAITRKNIVSLLIGFLLLGLLFNPIKEIPDVPHQSFLFTCTFLATVIGIAAFYPTKQFIHRLTIIDLLVILIAVGNIYFYPPTSNLFGLARFALIILYWSIRQTGGLNGTLLNTIILITTLVLSIIGYMQILHILPSHHPHFDITGPYGNPTIYAGILCLLLSAPIMVLSHFKSDAIHRYTYLVSFLTCIIALPILWLTHCRSAWIAVLAIISYSIYSRFSISFRWGISTLITIALLSYLLYQFKPASADGRILIWKVTAQMIKEKPFTGFGPHGFTANYMHFQSEYLKKEGSIYEKQLADNNHYVYNEPLRWTVEYGIAGLLLYIGILYCIFSYKKSEIQSLSAQAIYIAGLVWGLFSYPDQTFPILAVMTIALAEMSNRQRECVIKQLPHKYIFLKAVIFLAIAGQEALLIKIFQCHRELYQISHRTSSQSPEEIITSLSQLETAMKNETIFWPYYCHTLYKLQRDSILLDKITYWEQLYPSTHTYILKGDALQRTDKIKEAETAYWAAHFMVPSRQKARYKLALMYYQQKRISEANRLANEVLTEKVKVYGFETYEMHRELRRIFEDQLQ